MKQKQGRFYNDWTVVITGASSGIGQALAEQLAPYARRLILVARREERLNQLKMRLENAYAGLEIVAEAIDLTHKDSMAEFCDRTLKHYEVDLLINNAGRGLYGPFDMVSWEILNNMIDLNVVSLTYLSHRFLPSMIRNKRGGIMNISSGFGLAFLPGYAGYIATKHFVTGLTEALLGDVAGTGVRIAQICPGPVTTEFTEHITAGNPREIGMPAEETRLLEISPSQCALEALEQFTHGKSLIIPGGSMKFILALNAILPRSIKRSINAVIGSRNRKQIHAQKITH